MVSRALGGGICATTASAGDMMGIAATGEKENRHDRTATEAVTEPKQISLV